jgi:hypothetical protein
MTDVEKRAKRIVYDVARAVERWRERNGGKDPIIVIAAPLMTEILIGAPMVASVDGRVKALMGCRVRLIAETTLAERDKIYLCEEVAVCG